ncbi:hypothetical protein [Bacillus sp. SRB_331]|uniref:hypothetical protein n=1 Tax=Bacillus sp. SRB_331 TaxID=1969379 RepID=UPI000DC52C99|nr:hypothetical protein [Bacillus sp. SRB_331]RAN83957.1 hypothetical protein B5P42_08055 [Bacillus sp. SRB_331]
MEQKELCLRKVQYLICDIMDEMNMESEKKNLETLQKIDHLSGAIGDLVDPSGTYSLDYLEGKVHTAHYLLFKNERKAYLCNK